MKPTLMIIALAATLPAGAALAGGDNCSVPRAQWQPREAVMQLAADNGWTVSEFEIDDGCYEIEGRDREGRRIEVDLDPATLRIVKMEYEDGAPVPGRNPAPSGTVAPPQNGASGNGTAPAAEGN